jgi:hypothetical protein
MKIKTAVEWLIEKLDQNFDYVADTLIEQAKQMEKEQIKQAYNDGKAAVINIKNNMSLEEYYYKTFKNETK